MHLKLQDCHHAFSDEELLKKKVEAIHECYLETNSSPSLQVILAILKMNDFRWHLLSLII